MRSHSHNSSFTLSIAFLLLLASSLGLEAAEVAPQTSQEGLPLPTESPQAAPLTGPTLRPLVGRLAIDLKDLVRGSIDAEGKAWGKFGLSLALVAAMHSADDQLRAGLDPSGAARSAEVIRPLGQEAGLALLVGSWTLGDLAGRPTLQRIGRDGLEATVISAGVLAPLIKKIAGRERPRREMGSGVFGGSGQSFPSGEVTQAFTIASVVSAHSNRKWVKGLAWTLATATAWQRMELDAHWASDVTAGALLGTAVGRWVVRRNRGAWAVEPLLGDRSAGVNLRREF